MGNQTIVRVATRRYLRYAAAEFLDLWDRQETGQHDAQDERDSAAESADTANSANVSSYAASGCTALIVEVTRVFALYSSPCATGPCRQLSANTGISRHADATIPGTCPDVRFIPRTCSFWAVKVCSSWIRTCTSWPRERHDSTDSASTHFDKRIRGATSTAQH